MSTFILFLLLSTGEWFYFLPAGPELNTRDACVSAGQNLDKTNPEVPVAAFFCQEMAPHELEILRNKRLSR